MYGASVNANVHGAASLRWAREANILARLQTRISQPICICFSKFLRQTTHNGPALRYAKIEKPSLQALGAACDGARGSHAACSNPARFVFQFANIILTNENRDGNL